MTKQRHLIYGVALAASVIGLAAGGVVLNNSATAQQDMVDVPLFEVDAMWPKPIPEERLLGMTIGAAVDAQDNLWVVHRSSSTLHNNEKGAELNPPTSACCRGAAPVLAFNPDGDLIHSWGKAEGHEWPESMHGVFVDHKGFVWLGGNGAKDSQILKFTKDGKYVGQGGQQGKNEGSNDPVNYGRVAQIYIDPKTNEGYAADGYKNRRLVVFDGDTGKIKKFWGAYGKKPNDDQQGPYKAGEAPRDQYANPVHCVALAEDGLLYVCDRVNDRVQVFRTDGTFIKEVFYAKNTLATGSTWELAFSKDPQQRFIYLTDGQNERIRIIDRASMNELTSFGRGGRQPGQFYGVHSIAVDSKGNIYTTETFEGKRIQKFVYKGMGKVMRGADQGSVWPRRGS